MFKTCFVILVILPISLCHEQSGTCPPYPTAPSPCTVGPCDQTDHAPSSSVNQCIGTAASVVTDCFFYLNLLNCYQDSCDPCTKARLIGYYQTCRNEGQVAVGSSPDFPSSYNSCINDCTYANYVSKMRRCLQETTYNRILTLQNTSKPFTCVDIVDGIRDDASSGIIGSHTECNRKSGFCTELNHHGRRCFAYGLGNSWGPICIHGGGFTPGGSFSSVGLCHFVRELTACWKYGITPIQVLNDVCSGYQDGCLQTDKCNSGCPKLNCMLACPTIGDIPVIEKYFSDNKNDLIPSDFRQYIELFLRLLKGESDFSLENFETVCVKLIGRQQPGCYLSEHL